MEVKRSIDHQIFWIISSGVLVLAASLYGLPLYRVWLKFVSEKVEYHHPVTDFDAILAQRAARANRTIEDSLRGNPSYLRYIGAAYEENDAELFMHMGTSSRGAPIPIFHTPWRNPSP